MQTWEGGSIQNTRISIVTGGFSRWRPTPLPFAFIFCFASFSDMPFSFVDFSDMPFSFISGFIDAGFEDDGSVGFTDLGATLGGVGW